MSEDRQLRAVNKNGANIEYIINVGIIPSKAVRMAAIQNGGAWKLTPLLKAQYPLPDDEWIECIKHNSNIFIQFIKYMNPSEQVLAFTFANTGLLIQYYMFFYPDNKLSNNILNIALTEENYITKCRPDADTTPFYNTYNPNAEQFNDSSYEGFIKWYFKDNQLVINKWIRYAKNIRENS